MKRRRILLRIRSRRNGIVGMVLLGLVTASAVFLFQGQRRVEATTVDWLQGEPALVDERPFNGAVHGDEWSRSDCVVRQVTVVGHYNYNRGKQEQKQLCTSSISGYELGQNGLEVYVRPYDHKVFYILRNIGYVIHLHGTDTAFIGYGKYVFGRGVTHHVVKIIDMSQRIMAHSDGVSYNFNTDNPAYQLVDANGGRAFAYGWGISNNGRYLAYADGGGSYGRFSRLSLIDIETGQQKMFGRGYYIDEYSYESFPEFVISNDGGNIIAGGNGAFKMWQITKDCQVDYDTYIQSGRADDPCPSRGLYPKAHSLMGKPGNTKTHRMRINDDFTELSYYLDGVHPEGRRVVTLSAPNYYPHGQLDYLAMGDSYSSGEGDIEADGGYYLEGTERRDGCHVSRRSYPFLLSDAWKMGRGKFRSIACSGARIIPDYIGRSESYRGQSVGITGGGYYDTTPEWALSGFRQGHVPQLEFVKRYKPKVVTLTGGGNDVGFGDILKYCAFPGWESLVVTVNSSCRYASDETAKQELKNSIRNQYRNMRNTIRKIKMVSPGTKIYLIGYPQFIDNPWLSCGYNTASLDRSERSMIREMVREMNNVLWRAAVDEGVPFIDIENSLEGGQLCAGGKYVTGFHSLSNYKKVTRNFQEMFHPNAAGHRRMSEEIVKKVPMPLADHERSQRDALSGDEYAKSPLSMLTRIVKGVVAKGRKLVIEVKNSHFRVGSSVSVTAYSLELHLGNAIVGDAGAVHTTFDIPAGLGVGNHVLVLRGIDTNDQPVTLYQFFTVHSAVPNDMDGDGILDHEDRCQFIRQWHDEQTGEDVCTVRVVSTQTSPNGSSGIAMRPSGHSQALNTTPPKYAILAATGMNVIKDIIIPLLLLLSIAIGAILLYAREQCLIRKGLKEAPTEERRALTIGWLRRVVIIFVALLIVVFMLFEVSGFGGQVRFYAKWIECGKKPLQSGIVFKNVVHYEQSPAVSFLRFSPDYFCSEREAEIKGYSASSRSYDYPHLTAEERTR